MNLQQRITLLTKLGNYLLENNEEWQNVKELAARSNSWFIPQHIDAACAHIAKCFLDKGQLENFATQYVLDAALQQPKNIGIVMAGNIPMVGFHDFLCAFVSGNKQTIKLSSKDNVLLPYLVKKLINWEACVSDWVQFADSLKNCDAYIATGSNNSGRYFEYYFKKYPCIIRQNRTSVAILKGGESAEELEKLSLDLIQYFGLGCRNVTKLWTPEGYDFVPLLAALKKYDFYLDFHKYKHNYDYQLAILLMNNHYFMNSGALIFTENESVFSPISQVHFSYYKDINVVYDALTYSNDIQCIVGDGYVEFGQSQLPQLLDYADNVDTMAFLIGLQ